MKYNRVTLISPPLDEEKIPCIDTGYWVPLNLLTLSSFLRHHGFTGEIQILDHQVLNREEIKVEMLKFQPDLVGISPNIDTYQETLKLAALAKQTGADVVLGGHYATELAVNILNNQPDVDYVVARDGEIALADLVDGKKPESINNLVFREHERVILNEICYSTRASYSDYDYSLIDLMPYFNNYAQSLNPGTFKKPAAFMTQRGCVWREKSGGCIFCSRIEPFARFDNVNEIWRRIGNMRSDYGIDAILDVSDDFLGNGNWFHSFYHARPDDQQDFGLRFIYSRVNHINPVNADILADLNTREICLGIESGDRQILRNAAKGSSPEQQLQAVKLLEERGINLIISFMVGLPGETADSIKNTMEQAAKMLACSNINELVISILIPLPGSQAYNMLIDKDESLAQKYCQRDFVDIREMQRDWVNNFCEVDFDTVAEQADQINKLSDKTYLEMI